MEEMQTYIGLKTVNAKPMTRQEYNDFRGWALPEDENGNDAGYLVEYIDGGKANTDAYDGYVSWSPSGVFEKAYRKTSGMQFGHAVEVMKRGGSVSRAGWNGRRLGGKPMYVYLICSGEIDPLINKPFFLMVHADSSVGVWVPVVNDVLAEDWFEVGEE